MVTPSRIYRGKITMGYVEWRIQSIRSLNRCAISGNINHHTNSKQFLQNNKTLRLKNRIFFLFWKHLCHHGDAPSQISGTATDGKTSANLWIVRHHGKIFRYIPVHKLTAVIWIWHKTISQDVHYKRYIHLNFLSPTERNKQRLCVFWWTHDVTEYIIHRGVIDSSGNFVRNAHFTSQIMLMYK